MSKGLKLLVFCLSVFVVLACAKEEPAPEPVKEEPEIAAPQTVAEEAGKAGIAGENIPEMPLEAIPADTKPADTKKVRDDASGQTSQTSETKPIQETEDAEEPVPENLVLKIEIIEETWIKITVDNKRPKEYMLKPGEHFKAEASSVFNLLLGNAGGVRLVLNDKPLPVPGKSGEVVKLRIP